MKSTTVMTIMGVPLVVAFEVEVVDLDSGYKKQ
jgi:hypothetical protein